MVGKPQNTKAVFSIIKLKGSSDNLKQIALLPQTRSCVYEKSGKSSSREAPTGSLKPWPDAAPEDYFSTLPLASFQDSGTNSSNSSIKTCANGRIVFW